MVLKDYRIRPASGKSATSAVIFLHGLGDSGSGGLLEIGRIWQRVLPDTEFICPDAPFAYDMAPPEFGGRQWFSLKEFSQTGILSESAIDDGVKAAAPILNQYFDSILEELHLASNKVALVGFSQGTMMSLHVALRRVDCVAAVIGYSGLLPNSQDLAAEQESNPPVLLAHGVMDEVVPFAAMGAAEKALKSNGINVRTVTCQRLGHSIDDVGITAGMQFLQQYF